MTDDTEEYRELVAKARETNLADVEVLGHLDVSHRDALGRPLVVVYGKRLTVREVNMQNVFLHYIREMDGIASEAYTLVYFNSKVTRANLPSTGWLIHMYRKLPYRYRKNVAHFSIVHPSFSTRFLVYTMYPFLSSKAWKKLHFADHPDELFLDGLVERGVVEIPTEAEEEQKDTEEYLKATEKAFEQGLMR
ncbi:hypothetical protein NDN08_003949 [Rhodosorus marinus]|uniref:CRAL-TRIO domain-containing protein n=1 Tax=Rhodosorus marinus TaxID=101924 RepID=A0AAV8UGW8_9RHOD|nr:hypothetical protein NDN08_003949 [Rhodosorus marinus]